MAEVQMYFYVLAAHGAWRWVVLALGVVFVVDVLRGLSQSLSWQPRTGLLMRLFGISVDIQILMGAVLYLMLSPSTTQAMSSPDVGIKHAVVMLCALVLVHLGAVMTRRAPTTAERYQRALLFNGLTLLIIVVGTPWWRPLLRN
jgi:hypothetical protein